MKVSILRMVASIIKQSSSITQICLEKNLISIQVKKAANRKKLKHPKHQETLRINFENLLIE